MFTERVFWELFGLSTMDLAGDGGSVSLLLTSRVLYQSIKS